MLDRWLSFTAGLLSSRLLVTTRKNKRQSPFKIYIVLLFCWDPCTIIIRALSIDLSSIRRLVC